MRVLVTGSRQFTDIEMIYRELDLAYETWFVGEDEDRETFIVTHGLAPGADTIANTWCWDRRGNPIPPVNDPHPADWAKHGSNAGRVRNTEMVQLRPDLVLAFFWSGARNDGTRDCLERARAFLGHTDTVIRDIWSREGRTDGRV
jgi:hypothetical protein